MPAPPETPPLLLAVPKGRILKDLRPLLSRAGIEPEADFDNPASRRLRFATSHPGLSLIRVRSFDAATFVAVGAAQLGVVGEDALREFSHPDIHAPLDLNIGACRLSVAARPREAEGIAARRWTYLRVATKYPGTTRRHFIARGIHADCIKLNGAMELAAALGICHCIVDLVSTGRTLAENGLVEVESIAQVTSRLIVSREALRADPEGVGGWVRRFEDAVHAHTPA